MAEEKMISVEKMDEILKDYFPEETVTDFHGQELVIKKLLGTEDFFELVRQIADGCFGKDGEYMPEVSDLLLRHTDGVVLREGCSAGGWYLGCTAEGEELREGLRRYIFGTRPPGALSGHFSGQVEIAPVYTRSGRESTPEDLCMLVTGMIPVIYTDPSGAVVG